MHSSRLFLRTLLGGRDPARFMAEHWQRKPLLIRQAVAADERRSLPGTQELFALARREDVEARVVAQASGKWSLRHGPFETLPKRKRDWTLLVQGVNLHHAGADRLMRRFDFLPESRLDDAMFSYAADGGGVGPHFDSYDVFLLQVEGRRRWRIGAQSKLGLDAKLDPDAPLRILRDFVPEQEWVLEPGDMLYLPPRHAHEGTALGPCITCSIGFRAPSHEEIVHEFLIDFAEKIRMSGHYGDRGRRPVRHPGRLDDHLTEAATALLARIAWGRRDVEAFLGRYLTEPKPTVFFEAPARLTEPRFVRAALRHGLRLDLKSRMQYQARLVFVNGDAFPIPAGSAAWLYRFADQRCASPAACVILETQPALAALLHDWHAAGWLTIGTSEGMPAIGSPGA